MQARVELLWRLLLHHKSGMRYMADRCIKLFYYGLESRDGPQPKGECLHPAPS